MKSILLICTGLFLVTSMAACSPYMEATRPTPVDLNYFQTGMSRDAVLEKLGAPDNTAIESEGSSCDFYKLYTRGYGAGGKIPIAIAEGAADVFTLGLAEIVLTPTEGVTENEKHPVAFCYHGQTLARINAEGEPNATGGQSPPISAASSDTSAARPSVAARTNPIATVSPSSSAGPAAVAVPVADPQVDDQWKSGNPD